MLLTNRSSIGKRNMQAVNCNKIVHGRLENLLMDEIATPITEKPIMREVTNQESSVNICNCASIIQGTFLFVLGNSWMILQNLEDTFFNSSSTHTMNDEDDRIRASRRNGHVKFDSSFLDSHASKIHSVLRCLQ